MLPLRTKMYTSVSNDVTVTAHILPRALYVGMDVNQYIHQEAAQRQKFMTTTNSKTNMATVEEILIMYLLHKRQKQRERCRRRWSVRPLNTSRLEDGEFFSLVLPMKEIELLFLLRVSLELRIG